MANNDMAPFDAAVTEGVSANLCESVARLAQTVRGIDIGLYWARTRPAGRRNQGFHFGPDVAEVLLEAASVFRRSEPLTDARLTGFVVALDRPVEQFDGSAMLRVLINDKPRRVRAHFEREVYPQVIRAFQEKLAVSLLGDLFPVSQRRDVRNPRGLRLLEDQDVEGHDCNHGP